jgi:hypothetical protein
MIKEGVGIFFKFSRKRRHLLGFIVENRWGSNLNILKPLAIPNLIIQFDCSHSNECFSLKAASVGGYLNFDKKKGPMINRPYIEFWWRSP